MMIIMKLILAFLLLFPVSSFAADPWTQGDVNREIVYLVVHSLDWGQTRHIAKNPNQFYEVNPILGTHPSVGRVNNYFILTGLAHVGISHILPSEYRKVWQYVTISIEAGYVGHNFMAGVKVGFP